jgi:subtilisin family serine protease
MLPQGKAQDMRLLEYSRTLDQKYQTERARTLKLADSLGLRIYTKVGDNMIQLSHFLNGFPRFITTSNINAAATTSTSAVWPGGTAGLSLTGDGITLGIWDESKARTDHQEFGSRVTVSDGASYNSYHSTHVAGTMIASGFNPSAKGMSYMANLKSYDWNSDISEMTAAAANWLQVSNHSYAYITGWYYNFKSDGRWCWFGDTTASATVDYGFGAYESTSYEWDTAAWLAPRYLIVKSADNNRGEGPSNQPVVHWIYNGGSWVLSSTIREKDGGVSGFNCIPWQANAKNILTIGAVYDIPGGYQNTAQVILASFSGCGPTADGRIKPDLVANGISLLSAYPTSTTDYATMSGTSMATPNVSGSIGLLLEHQKNLTGSSNIRSATVKGLLIHTADEAGPNSGPDYQFGWGLLNAKKAALLMSENSGNGFDFNIRELSLSQGDTILIPVYTNGTEPLSATISWTDRPSNTFTAFVNDTTHMLVNDLDVRLISHLPATYYPWKLKGSTPAVAATKGDNNVDNVEKIEAGTPAAQQTWYVQITHKGTLFAGEAQALSLIISGIAQAPTTSAWNGNSSSDWYTPSNWSDSVPGPLTNITIPSGLTWYPTLTSRASCNNITIMSGASILDNGLLTVSDTAYVERYITKYGSASDNKYHFISSPVFSQAIIPQFGDPLNNSTNDFYKFAENTYKWINLRGDIVNSINPDFETNFVVGRGYLVAYDADGTKTFAGTLNTGNQLINISRSTTDPVTSGWNLVGNPYPSTIDWDAENGWTKSNLNNAIYITRDGGWAAFVGGEGTNGGTPYIASGQGFFVSAANVGSGFLGMTNSVRVHNATSFFKKPKSGQLARLQVSGNGFADEAIIRLLPEATDEFDGEFDAIKLFGFNDASAQIYSLGSDPLTINSMKPETREVPIGIRAKSEGTYTIAATEINAMNYVTLLDTKTGTTTDLTAKPYTFQFTAGENEQRFKLLFYNSFGIEAQSSNAGVYSHHKTVYIKLNGNDRGDLFIYTITGQLITRISDISGTAQTDIVTPGIYVVKLFLKNEVMVKKIWIW